MASHITLQSESVSEWASSTRRVLFPTHFQEAQVPVTGSECVLLGPFLKLAFLLTHFIWHWWVLVSNIQSSTSTEH